MIFCVLIRADTWPAPALHQCGVLQCRAVTVKCERHVFIFLLSVYPPYKSAAGCHCLFHHSTRNCLFGRFIFFQVYSFCVDGCTAHMLIYTIMLRFVALMFIIYSKTKNY